MQLFLSLSCAFARVSIFGADIHGGSPCSFVKRRASLRLSFAFYGKIRKLRSKELVFTPLCERVLLELEGSELGMTIFWWMVSHASMRKKNSRVTALSLRGQRDCWYYTIESVRLPVEQSGVICFAPKLT